MSAIILEINYPRSKHKTKDVAYLLASVGEEPLLFNFHRLDHVPQRNVLVENLLQR